jgi:hypothetical protein
MFSNLFLVQRRSKGGILVSEFTFTIFLNIHNHQNFCYFSFFHSIIPHCQRDFNKIFLFVCNQVLLSFLVIIPLFVLSAQLISNTTTNKLKFVRQPLVGVIRFVRTMCYVRSVHPNNRILHILIYDVTKSFPFCFILF